MTLSLARNLGPEIRANVVVPAMVTGRWHLEHLGEEKYEAQMTAFANSTPLRQRVDPDDIASAVCWLIDDAGRSHRPGDRGRCRRFDRRARSQEIISPDQGEDQARADLLVRGIRMAEG